MDILDSIVELLQGLFAFLPAGLGDVLADLIGGLLGDIE